MSDPRSKVSVVPVTLPVANRLVTRLHRHHAPIPAGFVWWAVGAVVDGELVGAAIAGRPTNRNNDDGQTVEVLRVATDGTPNAPSALLGACARAAKALGAARIITYTLESETGESLRGAGWQREVDGIRSNHAADCRGRSDGTVPVKRVWAVVFVAVFVFAMLASGCSGSRDAAPSATLAPLALAAPNLDPVTTSSTTSTTAPPSGQCAQWQATALAAGWTLEQWPTVDRIMWLESRCQPDARNPNRIGDWGNARGLMQVLDELWAPECGLTVDELYDPYLNLQCALHVFNRQGFEAWSTY